MVSRSRTLTRSRSRFWSTRWTSPAQEQPGDDLVDQGGRGGADPFEEAAELFASHQLIGMLKYDLAEMCCDDGGGLEDLAARELGDLSALGVDPDGGPAGHGVSAVAAVGPGRRFGRRHGQEPAGIGDPLRPRWRLGS